MSLSRYSSFGAVQLVVVRRIVNSYPRRISMALFYALVLAVVPARLPAGAPIASPPPAVLAANALVRPPGRCVIVVVADRLTSDALTKAPEPLQTLLQSGAVGLIHSGLDSNDKDGDASGYGSIGAGAEVWTPQTDLPTDLSGLPPYLHQMQEAGRQNGSGEPGSLGGAVIRAGGYTALVGNASGEMESPDTAALIAASEDGRITINLDHSGELLDQQSWPYRRRSSPQQLAHTVQAVMESHRDQKGLIVVETGDSSRVDRWVWLGHPDPSEAAAARAQWTPVLLQQLTELLEPLLKTAREHGCVVCLVSPALPRGASGRPLRGLTPLVLWGGNFRPGPLYSPSTRRPGLVLAADLAPTFLRFLSVHISGAITGRALEQAPGLSTTSVWSFPQIKELFALNRQLLEDHTFETAASFLFGTLVVFSFLVPILFEDSLFDAVRARIMQFWILASCACPAAIILPLAVPGIPWYASAALAVFLWLLFPLLIFRLRYHPARLCAACGIPALLVALDAISGGRLIRDVLLSRSPMGDGPRFYGLGSAAAGVFIGAGWIALGAWIDSRPKERWVQTVAAAIPVVIVIILDLSELGANPSGAIAAAAGAGCFISLILSRWNDWRRIALASSGIILGAVLVLASLPLGSWNIRYGEGFPYLYGKQDIFSQNLNPAWLGLLVLYFIPLGWLLFQNRASFRQQFNTLPGSKAALYSLLPVLILGELLTENGPLMALMTGTYLYLPLVYLHLARRSTFVIHRHPSNPVK